MQFAWIETFLAVVDRGGFCAAADSLFRSQSRVSAHIASLELELEAALFDRRRRPVSLTPAGQAFLDYAAAAMTSLDAGASVVSGFHKRGVGRIALGAARGIGAAFLPPLLAEVSRERPDFRVDIVEESPSALDKALLEGTLDITVRPRVPRLPHDAIRREPLWRERMVIVVPPGHRLARVEEPRLADVLGEPMITTDEAVAMLRAVNFEPHAAIVSDHPATLVACVVRGLGIGLTSPVALQFVSTDGALVVELADALDRVVDVCWFGKIPERSTRDALLAAIRRAPIPAAAKRPEPLAQPLLRLVEPQAEAPARSEPPRQFVGARRA